MKKIGILILSLSIYLISCEDEGDEKRVLINGNVDNTTARVLAIIDGLEVDSDVTDNDGDFRLRVPSEFSDVELQFETDDFDAETEISITPDSEVTFDVSLAPDSVTILNFQIFQNRIRISGNDTFIFTETEADFIIDGKGSDCIIAKGNSIIDISVDNITLADCGEGIRAVKNSHVLLETTLDINITAFSNGVRGGDNSFVSLTSNNSVFISSDNDNGIRTTGNSSVMVDPTTACTIFGGENAISEGGNSNIEADGCSLASS